MPPKFTLRFLLALTLFVTLLAGIAASWGAPAALGAFLTVNGVALALNPPTQCLGVSAFTKIADLWVPSILAEGMQEPVIERSAFLDSGVVATDPLLVTAASGPGTSISLPFIIEPNHADQQQTEDTAPEMRKLASGAQNAAIFARVSTLGSTALAGIVSGVKPGGDLLSTMLAGIQSLRKKQRNRLVVSQLSGLFDVTAAADANSGAFKALRLDHFVEIVGNQTSAHLIDSDMVLDALALSGENKELFTRGAIIMHSKIETALSKQDQIEVIRNSAGDIILKTYKGLTVLVSDKLVRAGTTSGFVYYTFVCGIASIAMGDKVQEVGDIGRPVIDAASLNINADVTKNNVGIYDRTRFILHPQGAKWTPANGVPAVTEAGPSNAEVEDDGNWTLGANDVKNVRIVCLRTNG